MLIVYEINVYYPILQMLRTFYRSTGAISYTDYQMQVGYEFMQTYSEKYSAANFGI